MSAANPTPSISLEEHEKALSDKDKVIAEKDRRIALLEEFVRLEKLRRFAASSEKISSDQQELFNEAELAVAAEAALAEQDAEPAPVAASASAPDKKPGRKPLPPELPRIRIEHELPAAERRCPCGCERVVIGEETSEQLDIIPAKVQVIVHARKKYACKACEAGVKTTPLSPQPIPKSNASPGLLAHVAVSKYQDALPLYRQEVILARHGIDIPRNTLASWMIKAGEHVQPLINLLEDQLLAYPVMHCDETTAQVLQEPGKPASSQSYMWVRAGGPPTQAIRLFTYADSRRSAVASHLLAGFAGYVQTDDYAGYNDACSQPGITQLGCWAHARRKFIEAQKGTSGKAKRSGKADMAISLIAKLYGIEKRIKDLNPDERQRIRAQEAKPQLEKIRQWLDKALQGTLPKGLLGKALSYLDRNWSKLTVYIEDGRLSIDNNPAENAIRPFAVGRKNWLFSHSVQGAKSSANLYSLIETAKANGIEPYAYLRKVFTALPAATTVEQVEALLPWAVNVQGGDD